MAAYASVAVARPGGDAAYWGRVSADEVGARIVTGLAAEGVDTSAVRRVPGETSFRMRFWSIQRGAADLRLHRPRARS